MAQNNPEQHPASGPEDGPPKGRGREKHELKTAYDVAALFAKLDPTGRDILAKDLVLAGDALNKLHPLVRAVTKVNTLVWIDDDKGRVTHIVRLTSVGPELARWDADRDGATSRPHTDSPATGSEPNPSDPLNGGEP